MRKGVVAVAALMALAFGGSAHAATWKVFLGEQTKPPAGTPKGTSLNQFFPGRIEVNAGDKITFQSRSFHNAAYLGGKTTLPPNVMPDPTKTLYENITDSAGQPFYFDALPKFIYNVAVFAPSGGKVVSGPTTVLNSGVLTPGPNGKPVSATFTFAAPGGYAVLCTLHPGMKMVVDVKPAGAPVQTAQDVVGVQKVETDAAWAKAKALAATKVPANTVFVGVGGKTTILGYFPKVLSVKAGTTVSFVNKSPSEPHNVTFGAKKYLEQFGKQTDFLPLGPNAKNQVTPILVYGTEPKDKYQFDGKNHGNGFFATPVSDGLPGGLPNVARVTFTAPGKFHYICAIHGPDMSGDIVVTP